MTQDANRAQAREAQARESEGGEKLPRNFAKAHCFFEQSGTFKNEFIKLGIPAEDYDIQNNFGQTDHVIDLFAEIEQAYRGGAERVR